MTYSKNYRDEKIEEHDESCYCYDIRCYAVSSKNPFQTVL